MSAPPTSTQMTSSGISAKQTGTQMAPSTVVGKRRRLGGEDEEGLQEKHINDSFSDSENEEDSDGYLMHEDVLERKQKKTVKLKVMTQVRHRNEGIGKIAGDHPVPKAATPLSRAIHEYVRMLMGIPRKSRGSSAAEHAAMKKLPDAPSPEELHVWETRRQRREVFIREAQDKALKKYLAKKPPGFKINQKQKRTVEKDAAEMATLKNPMHPVIFSSRISSGSRSKYAHHFAVQCESTLAMAGLPRCTFDWEASYDTPWNQATATIILSHWVKVYKAGGARGFGILSTENTASDREEILRRWCGNKATKFREQN
ncbi:uncharacterized protein MELLADRAFT_91081 [Melampsora larici-populina 98AG31]|uniref:Uncharacterized protein n=1 Tax=Melampsora larici-populina (strain 98AG31 / pathotype 3-4-7) TaxID=747676 RepID=F4R732_MELLP|nr:uncharacterized protein MELLADRAFT_91081 [Melampsora larici-populina 98AG31]EGG11509.1 hypothetical protein MELLADRAFT_91081 [Melampsora larici-populina 98AG31]